MIICMHRYYMYASFMYVFVCVCLQGAVVLPIRVDGGNRRRRILGLLRERESKRSSVRYRDKRMYEIVI